MPGGGGRKGSLGRMRGKKRVKDGEASKARTREEERRS